MSFHILSSKFECESGKEKLNIKNAFTLISEVNVLDVKLLVDGEEIVLNEFVVKILSGTIVGAVTSLRGIKKDWKQIEIKVTR